RALERAGHAAGDASVLRARELIRLAALEGGAAWERLLHGALLHEPSADAGFDAFVSAAPVAARPPAALPTVQPQRADPQRADEMLRARRQADADARAAQSALEHAA